MVWEVALRLFLVTLMGGLIGLEREFVNRPAGFRTHTLVCQGAALIMLTGKYLMHNYNHIVNLDPARLGAQVVSGIGFLGAGTIMNDGHRVRGLTTAASLWVVASIGLSIGAGFYAGGVIVFILAYFTLVSLKHFEKYFGKRGGLLNISMTIEDIPGQLAKVADVMGRFKVQIKDIDIRGTDGAFMDVVFYVALPHPMNKHLLLAELKQLDGIEMDRIS